MQNLNLFKNFSIAVYILEVDEQRSKALKSYLITEHFLFYCIYDFIMINLDKCLL